MNSIIVRTMIEARRSTRFGMRYFVSEPRKHHYIPVCYLKQWAKYRLPKC
jgi:hypothetical protein